MKVKVINETRIEHLEREVNSFLSNEKIKVTQIQFTESRTCDQHLVFTSFTAYITYREVGVITLHNEGIS